MKTVTAQTMGNLIEDIVSVKQKQAKQHSIPFIGVSQDELLSELNHRIGTGDWRIKKEQSIKFSKDDVNAVGNARFYRRLGMRILMVWAIVVLCLLQALRWFPNLPIYAYYALCGGVTIGFVAFYGKKQREYRKELWDNIEGDDTGDG